MKTCSKCGAIVTREGSTCPQCHAPLGPVVGRRATAGARAQDEPGTSGLVPDPGLWGPSKIGKRQPDTRSAGDRHFLVPPFGEPLRLEASSGKAIVLGRDEGCSLRIQSPTVSRRHAEISFRGKPAQAFVKDLGTKNGTHLNGAVLKGERALADKDLLRMGEVTAIYRVLKGAAADRTLVEPPAGPERLNATIPIAAETVEAVRRLTGEIAAYPVEDLLGRLMALRATGTLAVEVDGVAGSIRFEKGKVVESSFGGRDGEASVRLIAALRRGTFRFDAPDAR